MTQPATLSDKRAIVTGASRGIGAAIARALDAEGVHTLLVARHMTPLAAIAAGLRHAKTFPADLSVRESAARVADAAPALLGGPVDMLVNNAGIFVVAEIANTDDAAIDGSLALSVAAPFRLLRAILPAMTARKAGHIITIGSVADRKVFPSNAAYAAGKYGSRALHEATLAELRGTGVRATLVSPGPVDTPIWDPYDPDNTSGYTPRAQMLRPEHVADAVVWALARPAPVNIDELRLSPRLKGMDLAIVERLVCPEPHEPAPLVVRADVVTHAQLERGVLGCPVCAREWSVEQGVAHFGLRAALPAIDAEAATIAALLDLSELGGVVISDGLSSSAAAELARVYGALVIAIDAAEPGDYACAIDGATRVPVAAGVARGAALLRLERNEAFIESAVRAVAVSGRVVAAAALPAGRLVREIARDASMWVGTRENASDPIPLRRGAR